MDRLLSPTKITAWLDCPHYLTLRRAVDEGRMTAPSVGIPPFALLLQEKGLEHEHNYRSELQSGGPTVHDAPGRLSGEPFADWADRSRSLLAEGHGVLCQVPFVHDGMRGIADFLVRVEKPSQLGDFSYEPVDAKLARSAAKPGHVLQLCFYAEALTALQGVAPTNVHIHLGSGRTESIRLRDVAPYWRRIRHQLRAVIADDGPADTVPELCEFCEFCEFREDCEQYWRKTDALHYVAGIRRSEIDDLRAAGVATKTALASVDVDVPGCGPERLEVLQLQAALQCAAEPGKPPPFERIDFDEVQPIGLPAPDPADVFLDFEGHPFWRPDRDLTFLFGVLRQESGHWVYETRWAHSTEDEAARVEDLIRWLDERRAAHPGMHAYHYNHTERSSLERLAAEYGAAEGRLADLVRHGVFVDVFEVVRRRLVVGVESYGLKSVEALAGFDRAPGIADGASAAVEYDTWCADQDDRRLDRIASYNADDVQSLRRLRDWLLQGPLADEVFRADREPQTSEFQAELDELVSELQATQEDWKVLLAQLLEYWGREYRANYGGKVGPVLGATPVEQLDHPAAVAGLRLEGLQEPEGRQRNPRAVFTFPPQRLGPDLLRDGLTLRSVDVDGGHYWLSSVQVDADAGRVVANWGPAISESGFVPRVLVYDDWRSPRPKPQALADFARRVVTDTCRPEDAARIALLRGDVPRFLHGHGPGAQGFRPDLKELVPLAVALDDSCLAVQGPPGTGKTYTGAHLIAGLIDAGRSVGVAAFSHNAIDNLLRAVATCRPGTRILRHAAKPKPGSELPDTTYSQDHAKWRAGSFEVCAGTTWYFANDKMAEPPAVDVLVIDEAGQLGLADAIAAMGGARNVILLGDPLQLAQVSQAIHPGSAGMSVLEHLLAGDPTIPPDLGVFLDVTRRMHPEICSFISDQIYEGRLGAHPDCATQSVGGDAGIRWIRASHTGRDSHSEEEVALVVALIRQLVGRTWRDHTGTERPLTAADLMVVAPYNDQVDLLQATLAADETTAEARVGTVDRFQGQEAPVVVFSMTTSSGADMPRTSDFLFSRNRLNVAVSRARALAYVVCTEELLDTRARTVDEMRLIGTLCALVEVAEGST